MPAWPKTRSEDAANTQALPPTAAVESGAWTGDADEQQAELKIHLVGLVIAIALLAPLAVWLGLALTGAFGL